MAVNGNVGKKRGCCGTILMVLGVLFIIGVLASMFGDESTSSSSDKNQAAVTTEATAEVSTLAEVIPSTDDSSDEEIADVTEEVVQETSTDDNVSQEYKNALRSAEIYSQMMHMSKQGIYDQLTSEYGDHFDVDAAQYAIDNVDADWNTNALESGKVYYTEMAMSKPAIYDQLSSPYGDQFTAEEAQYAIDHLDD